MWSALDAEQELLRRSKKHLVKQLAELRAEGEDLRSKLRKSGDSSGTGLSSAAASSMMLPPRAPLLPTSHRLLWRPTTAASALDDDDDDGGGRRRRGSMAATRWTTRACGCGSSW